MFDKYMIVGEEFKNVVKDGKVVGFQIGERLPYYRGIVLSVIGPTDLLVDGEHYPSDQVTVTLHGNTYRLNDLENHIDDRWEFGEVGILTVEKAGGLPQGEHQVELTQKMNIAYVPFGFSGRDAKLIKLVS